MIHSKAFENAFKKSDKRVKWFNVEIEEERPACPSYQKYQKYQHALSYHCQHLGSWVDDAEKNTKKANDK